MKIRVDDFDAFLSIARNFIVERFTGAHRNRRGVDRKIYDRIFFFNRPPPRLRFTKARVNCQHYTRTRSNRLDRKACLIIYQQRQSGGPVVSIPSHQSAAVPCSQHRHILIYPNVLHQPSQFANRANHPIALTLPAIQRPRSPFYWTVPATTFSR